MTSSILHKKQTKHTFIERILLISIVARTLATLNAKYNNIKHFNKNTTEFFDCVEYRIHQIYTKVYDVSQKYIPYDSFDKFACQKLDEVESKITAIEISQENTFVGNLLKKIKCFLTSIFNKFHFVYSKIAPLIYLYISIIQGFVLIVLLNILETILSAAVYITNIVYKIMKCTGVVYLGNLSYTFMKCSCHNFLTFACNEVKLCDSTAKSLIHFGYSKLTEIINYLKNIFKPKPKTQILFRSAMPIADTETSIPETSQEALSFKDAISSDTNTDDSESETESITSVKSVKSNNPFRETENSIKSSD